MGDFLSFLGPLDPIGIIGNLTGYNQQQASDHAQGLSEQQLALQRQYAGQAAGVYGHLGQQGQGQYDQYNSQFLGLLNRFGSLAGLGGNTLNTSNQNGTGGGNQNQYANPYLTQLFGGQQQGGPQENPYALDQNQTALLNQQNANLARQAQAAYAQSEQQLKAQGISDPRYLHVAQQTINEHFAALKATQEAEFYKSIKDDKLKALQSIIGELQQYGTQGIGQQEAAGSGYLGLASGAQAAANQQQSVALQQQQNAQEQATEFLKGLALAAGAGGGGGGAAASASAGAGVGSSSLGIGMLGFS